MALLLPYLASAIITWTLVLPVWMAANTFEKTVFPQMIG